MSHPIHLNSPESPGRLEGVRYYLETFGCQMNDYDSSGLSELLGRHGLLAVDEPGQADVILVNSCSVREAVEVKILGRLSQLGDHRVRGRARLLAVMGCMSQRLGEEIQRRVPTVDLVLGTEAYPRIPEYIGQSLNGGVRAVDRHRSRAAEHPVPPPRAAGYRAMVTIMRGCDNHCTFCIVPSTRGPEVSRPAGDILRELRRLADSGTTDVTLLGQNVNSYRWGELNFARLLRAAGDVPGIRRVRFTTSNPQDMTREVLESVAEHPHVMEHVHLPVQAGSNRVLESMHRFYTRERYLALVAEARALIPGLALTTDVLVGFPGETEADFEETLSLCRTVEFDTAFAFKFSPRSGTPAAGFAEQVPEPVKSARLERLLALQKEITERRSAALVGQRVEVALEKMHPRQPGTALARTRTNRTVAVPAEPSELGRYVGAEICEARGQALFGRRAEPA
ncbi:MAG TPA: tRNA (N6-isopentenyl adenosine(37)-C2)-methylthiotransferase MiaB [Candidatus Saccharimonadales bacterium]|nr:tRNA (N6-isopentenyl adenosine(37)-C2)-methylthiotransferase MiaB [Candidatus Saccharimonadales bacterium]